MVSSKKAVASTENIIHPELVSVWHVPDAVKLMAGQERLPPIDAKLAKELLGWIEEGEKDKWKEGKFDLTDVNGKKVRLTNNTTNRPYQKGLTEAYEQEILNSRWQLNGETFTVTRTGRIASGQHRLVGLVFAEQRRLIDDHWKTKYPAEVTVNGLIVYGIADDDAVINTIDTGKTRTPADMIYRSDILPTSLKGERRREAARSMDFAVRVVWDRTGASADPYAPSKTHSEVMDLIHRHKGLVRAVDHITKENADDGLSQYIKPGYAAGLLYLFGASDTEREKYFDLMPHTERRVSFTHREAAEQFFIDLNMKGESGNKLLAVREAIGKLANSQPGGAKPAQRMAILIHAWNLYVNGDKISPSDLKLEYTATDDGQVMVMPKIGGIDLGSKTDQAQYRRDKQAEAKKLEYERKEAEKAVKKATADAEKAAKAAGKPVPAKKPAKIAVPAPEEATEETSDEIPDTDDSGDDVELAEAQEEFGADDDDDDE